MTDVSNVVAMPDRSTARGRVAAEVRAELGRVKITVNRLPKLVGKSQSYWSRRANGDQAFDVDDLEVLAALVGVPLSRFFTEAEDRGPLPPDHGWAPRGSNPQPTDYKMAGRVIELATRRAS